MSIYAHSNPYMEGKCMGFCSTVVWVMGYGRIMGFGSKIPANRVGGRDFLWVMAGYGLPRVWVKTGSTVCSCEKKSPPAGTRVKRLTYICTSILILSYLTASFLNNNSRSYREASDAPKTPNKP